ncbi:MAG: hypothetical protein HYS27_02340 [Deltaproteobacteria bacterium]|nr:hypothetical protein [Deltaproteobacteria bacterium]
MTPRARIACGSQARLHKRVGAVVGAQVLAVCCVPFVDDTRGPCASDTCSDGYRCCNGECIEGDRCPECVVEPAGLEISPACDCDSFLPMCVGARWQYDEFDIASGELLDSKTQAVTGFGDPGEPLYQKSGFNAYNVCRTSDDSLKLAWQTIDGERAASHVHR